MHAYNCMIIIISLFNNYFTWLHLYLLQLICNYAWNDVLLETRPGHSAETGIHNAIWNTNCGAEVITISIFLASYVYNVNHKIVCVNKEMKDCV